MEENKEIVTDLDTFIDENFPVIHMHNNIQTFDFMLKKYKRIKKSEKLSDIIMGKLSSFGKANQDWKLEGIYEKLKGISLEEVFKNETLVKLLNNIGIENFVQLVYLIENFPYMLFEIKGIGNKTYKEIITVVYKYLYNTFDPNNEENIVIPNFNDAEIKKSAFRKIIDRIIEWIRRLYYNY